MTEHPKFGTYQEATKLTGLSKWYLRQGVADGTVPSIKAGNKTLINLDLLMMQLDLMSLGESANGI